VFKRWLSEGSDSRPPRATGSGFGPREEHLSDPSTRVVRLKIFTLNRNDWHSVADSPGLVWKG